jgi:hypothetical protein
MYRLTQLHLTVAWDSAGVAIEPPGGTGVILAVTDNLTSTRATFIYTARY